MNKQSIRCAVAFSSLLLLGGTASWAQTQTVQVVSWNVHHPIDDATAQQQAVLIASLNPDIVVLQEARDSQRTLFINTLSQYTPYPSWVDQFAPYCNLPPNPDGSCTITADPYFRKGVVVLSRFPKVNSGSQFFMYQDQYLAGRGVAWMSVNVNGTIVYAFSVHLTADFNGAPGLETRRQMTVAIKSWALQLAPAGPRLVGGDFNSQPTDPAIVPPDGMTGPNNGAYDDAWVIAPGSGNGATHGTSDRFDYWFSDRGGRASAICCTMPQDSSLSDHKLLFAKYQVAGSSQTPTNVPGLVQAESFDDGGEMVAYHDDTPGNLGGACRATDVDLETTTDVGGGCNVGWLTAGEWMKYTVNATAAGTYTFRFRMAAKALGGTFHMEVDGVDVTGRIQVPNTGAWQNWQDIFSPTNFVLSAGTHVLRFVGDTNGPTLTSVANLNYFEVRPASETILLADNFDDNSFNTTEWIKNLFSGATDSAVPVNETAARLEIGPLPANSTDGLSHYNGARSVRTFDFTGASVYVELAQPSQSAGVYAMLTIGDSSNHYRFAQTLGSLTAEKKIANFKTPLQTVTYDAANHAFLRIEHHPDPTAGDRVRFWTAPKVGNVPGSWTLLFDDAWNSAVPATALQFEIKAGLSTSVPSPGTIAFDNLKASRPN